MTGSKLMMLQDTNGCLYGGPEEFSQRFPEEAEWKQLSSSLPANGPTEYLFCQHENHAPLGRVSALLPPPALRAARAGRRASEPGVARASEANARDIVHARPGASAVGSDHPPTALCRGNSRHPASEPQLPPGLLDRAPRRSPVAPLLRDQTGCQENANFKPNSSKPKPENDRQDFFLQAANGIDLGDMKLMSSWWATGKASNKIYNSNSGVAYRSYATRTAPLRKHHFILIWSSPLQDLQNTRQNSLRYGRALPGDLGYHVVIYVVALLPYDLS
ncbi:Protein of unknown function [Gryllus bimaculatus]|nr:Protein of unknown function [Gryllus bimaculatus]